MRAMCPLLRRDSYQEEEQNLHSECVQVESQMTDPWCPSDTQKLSQPLKKKRQGRYKNVPYTFGRHFRNWIETEIGPVRCPVVQKFISKRKTNPRYHDSLKDFNDLFQHSGIGRQLGQIFFGQKKWIQYLLNNERVDGFQIYFEVEKSYYEAATQNKKITEQKVRNY